MCGIIGYIGKEKKAIKVLLEGLKSLEYRGYDSAGIAIANKNKIKIIKSPGKIINLEEKIKNEEESNIGIGHTRWATHGIPNIKNAHPHKVGKVTLVHNGIIENYLDLKQELLNDNYQFKSDTDSEVICAYLDKIIKNNKDPLKSIQLLTEKIRGSYALAIIFDDDLKTLYATRKDSPLIIGLSTEENFISSDVPAILNETNKYYLLDQEDIAVLTKDKVTIYDKKLNLLNKTINTYNGTKEEAQKNGFPHYMIKEIYDEVPAINNFINHYISFENNEISSSFPDLSKYKKIDIVACGSAYHAGLIGKNLIEEYGNIEVSVSIASEYRYSKHFYQKDTLVILISQSGETADTLAALRLAKENHLDTLGIVNVVGSSIAREVDKVIYLNVGYEIAVATTKAYSQQVLVLSLLALNLAIKNKTLTAKELSVVFKEYQCLPKEIEKIINNRKLYLDIAKTIYKQNDIFFIGRKIDSSLCMEASLKIKEISYIHSESYHAGELKHGTISLITDKTPVISIITDETIAAKTISNLKETISRGAKPVIITTTNIQKNYPSLNFCQQTITVPTTNLLLTPLLVAPAFQLLSYEVAKLRGLDIDKPRNLAKSVTVE